MSREQVIGVRGATLVELLSNTTMKEKVKFHFTNVFIIHHKFSLSPFVVSGVLSFRLVLFARAMMAPPLQPPRPLPPLLPPSLLPFLWHRSDPSSGAEKFEFTTDTKIRGTFRATMAVGGAERALRTLTPEATTSVETVHRRHHSHHHPPRCMWGTFVSGLICEGTSTFVIKHSFYEPTIFLQKI